MASSDLDRFKTAQAAAHSGFATALAELRAGAKVSHWIWYVFPQLAGLGRSSQAMRFGVDGVAEAEAYLRDPVLRQRLAVAAAAAREHLAPARGGGAIPIEQLMGSDIDATKLVSSMTLFGAVAARLNATAWDPELAGLAADARAILDAAAEQGYEPCAFTHGNLSWGP